VRRIESCIDLACFVRIYAAAASSPEQKEKLSPRCRSCSSSSSSKPFFHNFIKHVSDNGF
jgi:hypothetical protein